MLKLRWVCPAVYQGLPFRGASWHEILIKLLIKRGHNFVACDYGTKDNSVFFIPKDVLLKGIINHQHLFRNKLHYKGGVERGEDRYECHETDPNRCVFEEG